MERATKKRMLGALMVILGFLVMTLYPYLIYMAGERVSYETVKATITLFIVIIGMMLAAVGGLLAKGAEGVEDTG